MSGIGGDTIAGGSVLVALLYFLTTLALRTRDMDRERSKFAEMAVRYARERERRIMTERDDAVAEVHRIWDELQVRHANSEAMLAEMTEAVRVLNERMDGDDQRA